MCCASRVTWRTGTRFVACCHLRYAAADGRGYPLYRRPGQQERPCVTLRDVATVYLAAGAQLHGGDRRVGNVRCCSRCISSPAAIRFRLSMPCRRRSRDFPGQGCRRVWPCTTGYDQSQLSCFLGQQRRRGNCHRHFPRQASCSMSSCATARITLVVLIVVPTVLGITVLILSLLGMSFNIMTLGGMAAAIGLVIDDAIVMIEHISRAARLKEGYCRYPFSHSFRGRGFLSPLAGSSRSPPSSSLCRFAFLGRVTGAFFRALSVTMASALIVSFAIAWFIVPLLADSFVSAKDADNEAGEKLVGRRMVSVYRGLEGRIRRRESLARRSCLPAAAGGRWRCLYASRHRIHAGYG